MGKKTEQGNVIEIVIIVVLLLVVGGLVVWRFMDTKSSGETSQTKDNNSQQTRTGTSDTKLESGYYKIQEWGIKIKLGDTASKVSFQVSNQSGDFAGGMFSYDGIAAPSFLPQYLQNKTCSPGVSLFRSKSASSDSSYTGKKVGDYYYIVTGGPGACSADPQNPDDQLKGAFLGAFRPENIEPL